MKVSSVLAVTLLATTASASWFSSEPETPYEYAKWNQAQLEQWLKDHNIQAPQGATQKQLKDLVQDNWNSAQSWTEARVNQASKTLADLKESAFDTWDESQLRSFLVDHGVVAPSGPKEKLIVSAKQYYRSYASAVSSLSAAASATASTAVYGDYGYQASKSASSASQSASAAAASGSARAAKALEDSKDYIYSTWSDSDLRAYLEKQGVVKTQAQLTREQLLAQMRTAYAAAATLSTHQWLVDHGIIKSDYEKNRDKLIEQLQRYYYGTTDTVYSTWSDNQLRDWLVQHNIVKSDAQIKREKLQKLVRDNYLSAKGTAWDGWTESELLQRCHHKTADYLTWPDARLRAYLRAHGVDESQIPATRPGLLHETRIRWVQTTNAVENFLSGIKNTVNDGVNWTEAKLAAVLNILGGHKQAAQRKASEAGQYANEKADQAHFAAQSLSAEAGKKTASAKAEL
ncbi:putative stress-responsive nuclear envelope protein [Rhizoctonia solani]|uniref:Putative stress-responsive nuclear envelope protein n=1 Tax=Rhizoctonia solani TaxID=456999 RepID=A0A8H7M9H6_9AGAM|nr:putative stress-responsive nuclear envelope protein [Rhizoctonia solani]